MEGPPDQLSELPDSLWETAARFRLGTKAAAGREPGRPQGACRNTTAAGRVCGEQLGQDDLQPIHCACGGGVVLRHGALARTLGRIVGEHTGASVKYEQHQPQLDKVVEGDTVRAIMDVCYHDQQGQHLIDVCICSPCAGEQPRLNAAAKRDGEAAARQVRNKYARYGETVTPFVLEVGGRPAREAREWVKGII